MLWGRRALLAAMPAWRTGGEMVAHVDHAHARLREPPHRFEAGTPNIAGVIGLGAAIRYLQALDRAAIARQLEELRSLSGVRSFRSRRVCALLAFRTLMQALNIEP